MKAIRGLYLLWCRMLAVPAYRTAWIAMAAVLAPAVSPGQAAARAADTPLSPRNASYTINARLDPARHTISGDEVLTWKNPASQPARSLQFHLYYNAWRDDRSTWMRDVQLGGPREARLPPAADRSSIDVSSLKLLTGTAPIDLTARMRFIAPDDGNRDDRTVMEVPLETPVPPA